MGPRSFDLKDRLLEFAATTCVATRRFPKDRLGFHVGDQLVRSCTSPAANHSEAQSAESKRDFIHKMRVALKKLRESHMWLRLAKKVGLADARILDAMIAECDQLIAIFVQSVATATKRGDSKGSD